MTNSSPLQLSWNCLLISTILFLAATLSSCYKIMNRSNFQVSNKPFRYTVDEWFDHNKQQYRMTQDRGVHAEKLLEQSGRIRDRAKELTEKKKYETEWRFKERIRDIQYAKNELENVRKMIQDELEALELLQERIQDEVKYVGANAWEIVCKCMQLREGRTGIDLIHDEVERELEREGKKIKEAEALLHKTLSQTKETKRDLRASLYLLNKDVERKLNCLVIETECLSLKESDLSLEVYRGNQTPNKSNITVEEWARYSKEIMTSSERKIQQARVFQVHIKNILEEVVTELREQYFMVNDVFLRRILEVKETKARLETQHSEVTRQVNDMIGNISDLEKAIRDKQGFLALAQTRLDKRTNRPGTELVKDEVEVSLVKEVMEIKYSVAQLQYMLSEAEKTLRYLLKAQVNLEEDINLKTNSIKIDEVDCMTLRQSINYHLF